MLAVLFDLIWLVRLVFRAGWLNLFYYVCRCLIVLLVICFLFLVWFLLFMVRLDFGFVLYFVVCWFVFV